MNIHDAISFACFTHLSNSSHAQREALQYIGKHSLMELATLDLGPDRYHRAVFYSIERLLFVDVE